MGTGLGMVLTFDDAMVVKYSVVDDSQAPRLRLV
jgi:hypothetical protein